MLNKAQIQISFKWLFAIIAGIFILFVGIFFATKIVDTGQTQVDASTAKQIEVLLNPLETGFESEKSSTMILPSETRIQNECKERDFFGLQRISVSQKSFGDWTDTDVYAEFPNKYIFSDEFVEGEKFYLTSKPFEYPFKIADLIILTSKSYCFVDVPEELEDEIPDFQENIKTENCDEESIRICFGSGTGCDVEVHYAQGYVEKDGEEIEFTGNLLYAAIFSDKEIYDCQLKRLMQRIEQLASLYKDKSLVVAEKNCVSDLNLELSSLETLAKDFENYNDFVALDTLVENIIQKNKISECRLW